MKCAISAEEKARVMGQNLNGCERTTYLSGSWVSHFKPVYEVRKDEYLNDANVPFDPDVDWPIDTDVNTGGWFRDPANISVTDINDEHTTFIIEWTTPEPADSNVVYTSSSGFWSGYWWWWKDGQQWKGPDGGEHDTEMVYNHSITISGLNPGKFNDYEFKIRSTNDVNDPPSVPGEIIWGYVGKLNEY